MGTQTKRHFETTSLILASIFTAVIAICSLISIPLPFTPIPLNLGTFGVMLTGTLLGSRYGTLSVFVYVLLGAIGLPIFHNFTGGFGVILGPTGGYIVSYIFMAFICGFFTKLFKYSTLSIILSSIVAMIACYLLGTIWFSLYSGVTFVAALMLCVVPFIIGDVIKILLVTIIARKVLPFFQKNHMQF